MPFNAVIKRTWYFAVKSETERGMDQNHPRCSLHKRATNSDSLACVLQNPPKPTQKLPKPPPKIGNVSKSESIEEKEDIDSDYYPEVILENLEREYDETHNPHRKGKKAKGINGAMKAERN